MGKTGLARRVSHHVFTTLQSIKMQLLTEGLGQANTR